MYPWYIQLAPWLLTLWMYVLFTSISPIVCCAHCIVQKCLLNKGLYPNRSFCDLYIGGFYIGPDNTLGHTNSDQGNQYSTLIDWDLPIRSVLFWRRSQRLKKQVTKCINRVNTATAKSYKRPTQGECCDGIRDWRNQSLEECENTV